MTNPIKEDPILRRLLQELDSIDTKRDFSRWKSSFVERFSEFLSTDGEAAAIKRRNNYKKALHEFVKRVQQLENHVANGDVSTVVGQTTVRAMQCLKEAQKHIATVAGETETLIPGTGEQALEMGYTKFHMGAVLIRDGFEEYDRLSLCADVLQRLRETTCLAEVADKIFLEEMDNFVDKFDMFCDIMSDLGLHKAMMRCHKLNELPDEPESEPEPEAEPETADDNDNVSLGEPVHSTKSKTGFDVFFKGDDSDGRLELMTRLMGSANFDGEGSKSFTLGFPGVKPPSGPYIKYVSKEEYDRRKTEREAEMKRNAEADKEAYKPVQKVNFGLGNHYHGRVNSLNAKIEPDLPDYSSGTDSATSDSSAEKKKKKTVKKMVVKKVVKKKVGKKKTKSKEGGTTELPSDIKNKAKVEDKALATKPVPEEPSPPISVISSSINDLDDDELTMNTLSPPQKTKSRVPPAVLGIINDDSSCSSDDSESLTLMVDFDGIEGVKGMKRSNH